MSTEIDYTAYLSGSLLLNRRGTWLHDGSPFTNSKVATLFSQSVVWDSTLGDYVVRIGRQQATFSYSVTPYLVISICQPKRNEIIASVSNGKSYTVHAREWMLGPESEIYLELPINPPRLDLALCTSSAHQALLASARDSTSIDLNGVLISLIPLNATRNRL